MSWSDADVAEETSPPQGWSDADVVASRKPQLSKDGQRRAAVSAWRAENPVKAKVADFTVGATGLMRGGANLLGGMFGQDKLGEKIWPSGMSEDTGYKLAGTLADPVGWTVAGGAAKVLPVAKVLGQGFARGAGAVAKNVAGGAATGGVIGGLSEDGTVLEGAALGAGVGALAPVVMSAAAKGAGWAVDLVKGRLADIRAGKVLRDVAAKELPQIQAILSKADDNLSASQAASGVESTKWSALGARAKQQDSQYYSQKDAVAAANQKLEIQKIAGGATQTEAKQVAKASQRALGDVAIPIRDEALDQANTSGKSAFDSLIFGETARFAKTKGDSLAESGMRPLDLKGVLAGIQHKMSDPDLAGNEAAGRVLASVADDIGLWVKRNGGTIDAYALDAIRKNSVNSAVEKFMGTADPKAKQTAAAVAMTSLKPLFSKAIVDAGGTGYPAYLKTYEQGMKIVQQQKLGAKALEMLEKNPQSFVALVEGNNPKLVQKIFTTDFDIKSAMGEKFIKMQKVSDEIAREARLKELAELGGSELAEVLKKDASAFRLPHLFSQPVTITNKALEVAEEKLNKKTMARVYHAMRNGKDASALMNTLSTTERNLVLKAVKSGRITPYLAVGAAKLQSQQGETE